MTLFTYLVIAFMVATVASLIWGVTSMAHGGHYDDEHSEKLMIARVGFQALTFVLLIIALLFSF
jgi:Hypoxia induced protein conserved region/Protein of unknown function (DUF2909)